MSLGNYLSVCLCVSLGKKLTWQEDQKLFKTLFGLTTNDKLTEAQKWLLFCSKYWQDDVCTIPSFMFKLMMTVMLEHFHSIIH